MNSKGLGRVLSCVLCVLIAFTSVGLLHSNVSAIYWAEGNIFNGLFTEPCEISYVVFWDGYLLKFTSYENWRIGLSYGGFKEAIESKGRKMEDIAIKIHNHLRSPVFSPGDFKFERWMREDGFVGSYCIRLPLGTIICRKDKNEALLQLIKTRGTKKFLKKFKKKYPEAYQELVSFLKEQVK